MNKLANNESIIKAWGPPRSPVKGFTCTHKRPRKRRNRVCRECGYWTVEECRNGGRVSGRVRLWRVRNAHAQILDKQGKWSAVRTARFFGYCERHIRRLWSGAQRTYATIASGHEHINSQPTPTRYARIQLINWYVDLLAGNPAYAADTYRRWIARYGRRIRRDDPALWRRIRNDSKAFAQDLIDRLGAYGPGSASSWTYRAMERLGRAKMLRKQTCSK